MNTQSAAPANVPAYYPHTDAEGALLEATGLWRRRTPEGAEPLTVCLAPSQALLLYTATESAWRFSSLALRRLMGLETPPCPGWFRGKIDGKSSLIEWDSPYERLRQGIAYLRNEGELVGERNAFESLTGAFYFDEPTSYGPAMDNVIKLLPELDEWVYQDGKTLDAQTPKEARIAWPAQKMAGPLLRRLITLGMVMMNGPSLLLLDDPLADDSPPPDGSRGDCSPAEAERYIQAVSNVCQSAQCVCIMHTTTVPGHLPDNFYRLDMDEDVAVVAIGTGANGGAQ